jgi:nucleolar protein 14
MSVLETIIRHLHSMAKTGHSVEIAKKFRLHLEEIRESRPLLINTGDLVIFTAIGTIFPTSDHFHQVITSTTLTMTRYLGVKIPQNLSDFATGAFLSTQLLQYQRLSKRYIPEVMNFIENSLCILAPAKMSKLPGYFPSHEPKQSIRIADPSTISRRTKLSDCKAQDLSDTDQESLKVALLETNLKLVDAAMDTWAGKPSAFEILEPVLGITEHLNSKR